MAERTSDPQRDTPTGPSAYGPSLHREGHDGADRGGDRLRQGVLVGAFLAGVIIGIILGTLDIRAEGYYLARPESTYRDSDFKAFEVQAADPTASPRPTYGDIWAGPMDDITRVSPTEPPPGPTPKPTPKPKLYGGPYKPWRTFNANVQAARNWLAGQLTRHSFYCIDVLWDRESRWRVHAENKSSGAYGIPQALPGKKMAVMGDDWRDNALTQVRWGLRYIKARYGNPCIALDHSYRTGWY